MQNFTISPTGSFRLTPQFFRRDGAASDYIAPITYTADHPELAALTVPSVNPNERLVTPILPAAGAGGIITISGTFKDENGVPETTTLTVTIAVNPNPTVALVF